jgi:hypothetical protein
LTPLIQGLGGLMSITGTPHGEPGCGPLKAGVALTDVMTGLYATVAILAALARRERPPTAISSSPWATTRSSPAAAPCSGTPNGPTTNGSRPTHSASRIGSGWSR